MSGGLLTQPQIDTICPFFSVMKNPQSAFEELKVSPSEITALEKFITKKLRLGFEWGSSSLILQETFQVFYLSATTHHNQNQTSHSLCHTHFIHSSQQIAKTILEDGKQHTRTSHFNHFRGRLSQVEDLSGMAVAARDAVGLVTFELR